MNPQVKVYFEKFKIPIVILVISVLLGILLITKIVPVAQKLIETDTQISSQAAALEDKKRNLEDLTIQSQKKTETQDLEKAIFKPVETGLDTESVMAFEFNEILNLIRANSVKMRSIKYDYNPADDNFVKGAPNKFDVSRLDLEMVADYKDFEGFLKDLYKHEHFLDISKIEIAPYQKDKKILLINFQMKLYAEKSGSSRPAPSRKTTADPMSLPDGGMPDVLQ